MLQINQYTQKKGENEQFHLPRCLLKLYVIHWGCNTGNPSMFLSFKKQVKICRINNVGIAQHGEKEENLSGFILVIHLLIQ